MSGKQRQVVLRVMIVNTNYGILLLLQEHFGGGIPKARRTKHSAGKRKRWKPFRMLMLTGNAAVSFLTVIKPFVRLKRSQIDLALEFWDYKHQPKESRGKWGMITHASGLRTPTFTITRKVRRREEQFKQRMHVLNDHWSHSSGRTKCRTK